jgi:energy-coupling factor transport system ATP-binding protein
MDFCRMESVTFCYPKHQVLFEDISLSIGAGERVGFYGGNGTGKTTLAKLMTGLLKPQKGSVMLKGMNVSKLSLSDIGRAVGYVFQNPDKQLFAPTVYETVAFGLRFLNKTPAEIDDTVKHWLGYFGLDGLEERFPVQLSRGQKQRLVLAATLARGAEFFIMDEPTIGLDAYNSNLLSDYLDELKKDAKGYVIISHDYAFLCRHTEKKLHFKERGVIAYEYP